MKLLKLNYILKYKIPDVDEEIKKLKLENVALNFQNNYLNDIISNDISEIKQILHSHTEDLSNIHNSIDENKQAIVSNFHISK